MCSICGIVDFQNKNNVSHDLVVKMGNTLMHRGPDQQGVFINDYVAFEHNRLAIMDVEKGMQPMTRSYQGNVYTIVYNGEIYNTEDLRKEIQSYGIKLETMCDTEVVLYMYILYKEECAKKLNGIFGFVVYNEGSNEVYIARDRFGIKPLFYIQQGTMFLFASEVKGLLKHPKVKPEIDEMGLWQLLYLSPVKINGTSVFKNILEVPQGCCGTFKNNTLTLYPYWKLEAKEFTGSEASAVEETRYLLEDAIQKQLVSDVPLCTLLSGGLDSSIISSIAAQQYKAEGKVLSTYSFEYEGNKENFKDTLFQPQSDDSYAIYMAQYLGTNHTILTANSAGVTELLLEAARQRDLPGMADIDSSLLYYCRQIKQKHTVALSGECADEIFGGYPWFYRPEMMESNFFPWIHDPHRRISLFQDELVNSAKGYEFMSDVYAQSIKACPILDTDTEIMKQSRIATWLSTQYFMTSLLERKDRMSMASGVEVRVPFADHRILEYVYNVPWEIKFKDQVEKSLLRESMKGYLPDKILNRKKSPYPKTHDPRYEMQVKAMLQSRLQRKNSILNWLLDKGKLEELMQAQNTTWFGQLMSTPQLIAWLIQLDYWFEEYNISIV